MKRHFALLAASSVVVIAALAASQLTGQTLIELEQNQQIMNQLNQIGAPGAPSGTAAVSGTAQPPATQPATATKPASRPASQPASKPQLQAARTIKDRSYLGIVLRSREIGKFTVSKSNMSAIGKAISTYEAMNDKPPTSLAALVSEGLLAESQTHSPIDPKHKYVYAAPKPQAPGSTVVVYDPVSYNGQVAALLADKSVKVFESEEQFEQAMGAK